jgi:hypothetical protein
VLIVAIPKSASTSLATSLCELHGLRNETATVNHLFKHKQPPEVRFLHHYHALPVIDAGLAQRVFADDNVLYKLHVFPNEMSLQNLRGKAKVVLLREPEEIVLAEKRAIESMIHSRRAEFSDCSTEDEWMQRANEIGLYQDLQDFYERWQAEAGSDTLVVHYRQLIEDPQRVINQIESFLGWPVMQNVSLRQERYSRASRAKVALQRGHRLLRKLKRRLRRRLTGDRDSQ